jgi:hypothetical protein
MSIDHVTTARECVLRAWFPYPVRAGLSGGDEGAESRGREGGKEGGRERENGLKTAFEKAAISSTSLNVIE